MTPEDPRWKTDCRHFRGDRPCVFRRECPGCPEYSPQGRRVLILKIGALGDVLRTTPLLRALTAGPDPVHVTWVTGEGCRPLLEDHPRIDRVLVPGWAASELLGAERFDLLLSVDKDPYPTALAMRIDAAEKRGFGRDERGALRPLDDSARLAFDLGLSDQQKFFENERTYQEIVFGFCGLGWERQEYDVPAAGERDAGRRILAERGAAGSGPLVGFNTGAGGVFANKEWTEDGFVELAARLQTDGCRIVLLGGRGEAARNARIAARAPGVIDSGSDHGLRDFASVVAACDTVVTGDTLGMHLAIAARVPVVVLFGSTCPQEIELYGRGEKVVTPIDCHPCYRRECDIHPSCQERIGAETVYGAVQRALGTPKGL